MIHKTFIQKINDALGFTPEPPGELTQEQLDYIASQVPPTDISGKVDKISGKALSTNDYTNEDKAKVDEGIGGTSNSYFPSGW
jgi:hypothetical protein